MSKLIGITGGIGSGKTYVSNLLIEKGFPVFNSDIEAKKIMLHDEKVRNEIIQLFGEASYLNEKLNTVYLAEQIFNDTALKAKMNAIVHPAVKTAFEKWAKEQNSPLVFNESALLFEIGRYKDFDFTILITAPEEIKIQRILKRDSIVVGEIQKRMKNQWKDERKISLASFVIVNDGVESVERQLDDVVDVLMG